MKNEQPEPICESSLRSLLKGITYRILATVTTVLIALAITGEISHALTIGGAEFFAKLGTYYLHERAWARVPVGTIRKWMRAK